MQDIVKKVFVGMWHFCHDWPRCKLMGEGALLLLLALMLGTCAISFEEDQCDADSDLQLLPNYDYICEVEKLKDTSKEEAKELARYIFETEGMPNQDKARRIYDEIEKDQKSWWNRTKRAAIGFATGEGQSLEELGGSVASDMFLYGDVRDLIKHSWYKVTKNEKGDAFILTLATFGVVTEFVDVIDWVPAVLKAFRKVGALSEKMVGLLSDGMKRCMNARKIDDELKSFFSGIKSLTDSLGFARASKVMRHADTSADVAKLASIAKVAPNETYLLVKYSGKKGVKNLEDFSGRQYKVLREAAKKGPDALKNVKRYLNAVDAKTATARLITRLLKSIQSGHLTGFVHKFVIASPVARFLVVALTMICLIIATRKIWLSLRKPRIVVLVGLCLLVATSSGCLSYSHFKYAKRAEAARVLPEGYAANPGRIYFVSFPENCLAVSILGWHPNVGHAALVTNDAKGTIKQYDYGWFVGPDNRCSDRVIGYKGDGPSYGVVERKVFPAASSVNATNDLAVAKMILKDKFGYGDKIEMWATDVGDVGIAERYMEQLAEDRDRGSMAWRCWQIGGYRCGNITRQAFDAARGEYHWIDLLLGGFPGADAPSIGTEKTAWRKP